MRKFATALYAAVLLAGSTAPLALAQTAAGTPATPMTRDMRCAEETNGQTRTLYLSNAAQVPDQNETVAALRNLLDGCDKIYLVQSQNAIVVRAGSENMALAQKLLNDLDRPKKTYRLTYTVTEMDGTKKIGSQRFAMVLIDGQKTSLNQSSRVPVANGSPVATGSYGSGGGAGIQTQYTWMDVGTTFDATLLSAGTGAKLNSRVTQSGFVAAASSDGPQQPVSRNLTLEGSSMLAPGKPLALGCMDVPGSTRHLDVDVVMEVVP